MGSGASKKCEHKMMPWECADCTYKAALIKKKKEAKQFINANVWDGEDRSGAAGDWAKFSPDELQELIDELIDYLYGKNQ